MTTVGKALPSCPSDKTVEILPHDQLELSPRKTLLKSWNMQAGAGLRLPELEGEQRNVLELKSGGIGMEA